MREIIKKNTLDIPERPHSIISQPLHVRLLPCTGLWKPSQAKVGKNYFP